MTWDGEGAVKISVKSVKETECCHRRTGSHFTAWIKVSILVLLFLEVFIYFWISFIVYAFYFLHMQWLFALTSKRFGKVCAHITTISVKQSPARLPHTFFLVHFPLRPNGFEFCLHNLVLLVFQHRVDVTIQLLLLITVFLRFIQVFVHIGSLLLFTAAVFHCATTHSPVDGGLGCF